MSARAFSPDFRPYLQDPSYPWREANFNGLRRPPELHIVGDEGAAAYLGLDSSMFNNVWRRLKIPRVERGKFDLWELEIWRRQNDPFAEQKQIGG